VAAGTKRDQVLRAVMSEFASRPDMMDLQGFRRPATLTAPIVSGEDVLAKSHVRLRVQSNPRSFWPSLDKTCAHLVQELIQLLLRQ